MRFILLIQLLLLITSIKGLAQDQKDPARQPLSIHTSFFNHSVSVPFHKIISTPVHPGLQGGLELRYFENTNNKISQTLNLGGFNNKYNGRGFYLDTELAYRYKSKHRLFAEALFGGGYLRTFHPVKIYTLNNSGTYEQARDKGFSSALVSLAIGLGYDIASSSKLSFSPFIRYQLLFQTRYRPDLGVLPQSMLHVGIRVNINRQ